MKIHPVRHEDERRILTEWISNIPVKRCKVIEAKGKTTLGNHYHLNNDSVFYMLKGRGSYILREARRNSRLYRDWMFEGDCIFVPRGIVHTFNLTEDSILLEAASEPYDPNDEIQFTE